MKKYKEVLIWGFRVFSDNLCKIDIKSEKNKLLCTISPNSYGLSQKDPYFKKVLMESDFLVLDGVYFALASILHKFQNIKKNQGPEILKHFLKVSNENSFKVFFLGSTNHTLKKIQYRVNIENPKINVSYFSPSYSNSFSEEENNRIIKEINDISPDILFVGLSAPKQEIWAYKNRNELNVRLIACIGGVFDWYAGNYKEISRIWWQLRLGWLKRYAQRPELIFRDSKNDFIFFIHLFKRYFTKSNK